MRSAQCLVLRRLASLSSVNTAVSTLNRIPTPPPAVVSLSPRFPVSLPQSLSSLSRLSFSSQPHSHDDITPPSTDDSPADVSTEELKKRIGRYLGGDAEPLPSIFEAILERKLSGKHEETDDELMEEFRSKMSHDNGDQDFESDDDDSDSDSDDDDSDSNDDDSESDDGDFEFDEEFEIKE